MKKRNIITLAVALGAGLLSSCSLDVVPDNLPTIDHAFANRAMAERYLSTCYFYLPDNTHTASSVEFLGGDEFWVYPKGTGFIDSRIGGMACWEIGRGEQNSNDPYMNYWDGNMFRAIRDCNIFFENIDTPRDLPSNERDQWVAEVQTLKAYYHFWLLQTYGPIPIIRESLPINASPEEVRVYRDPVDDVVNYIVSLLDTAAKVLPLNVQSETRELGRITRPIALAIKAKTLILAASPLMNGNPDYANVRDSRGVALFPANEDNTKWTRAAQAVKEAIDCAEEAGNELYYFKDNLRAISDTTRKLLDIREAVCEKWNEEIVWGSTYGTAFLQTLSQPKLGTNNNNWNARSILAPTLKVVEQFYSANGVPIEEDLDWDRSGDYTNRYQLREATSEDNPYYIRTGYKTAVLHFNREPRFYADLGFDGGIWYNRDCKTDKGNDVFYLNCMAGKWSGRGGVEDYSITGYFAKKLISYRTSLTKDGFTAYNYAFPIVRLADLYLLYAEALNESKTAPDQEVYEYIDQVRERAGLKGVKESWANHSIYPDKPTTKAGMREIIRRERLNELALEGQRFWDLRRWKWSEKYLSEPVYGWNVKGTTPEEFYEKTNLYSRRFTMKDYLWPLKINTMLINPNLVQNPGW